MPIRARYLLLSVWLLAAVPAFAGTHTITFYADLGNDPGTGCSVTTSADSFVGAELALDTTIVTDTSGAQVTRVERRLCGGGSFGPPQLADPGSWPAGLGLGDGGSAVVETYVPLSAFGSASVVRVGIFSTADGGGGDAMVSAPGSGPILIVLGGGSVAEIPTLSGGLLPLLAVILGLAGWRVLRRRGVPLVVALLLLGGSAVLFAAVVRDGQIGDWAGQPLRGTDPAGDAPVNADLRSFYAQVEAPSLFLRIDADVQPDAVDGEENLPPTLDPVPDRTVGPNTTISLGLEGRDGNPFDALTYSLVSGPAGAVVAPQGVFSFTPTPAQLGGHSITVQVADPGGLSAQATFQVTVVQGNRPPVLDPLADGTTTTGASWTRTVTASDPDPGDPLTFSLLSGPAGMTLTGQQLSWTPAPDQTGGFPVRIEVRDAAGASDEGTFTVSVPLPGAPVAYDDRYEVRRGATLDIPAPGVLANDVEPGGGPLTATRFGDPDKGTVTAFGNDGSFTYVAPPADPPAPPLAVEMKWQTALNLGGFHHGPIGDFDGDGQHDIFFFHGQGPIAQVTVYRADGSLLVNENGTLPPPADRCRLYEYSGSLLADVDDDGKNELVTGVGCAGDWPGGIHNTRLVALSFVPAAGSSPAGVNVDWLSPIVTAWPNWDVFIWGSGALNVARLAPDEPPSILWGSEHAAPYCERVIAGTTGPCRQVTIQRGSDGTIDRRLIVKPQDTAGWDLFTHRNQGSPPTVADLDGDGQLEVLFLGTIWNADGSVRLMLDGTPGNVAAHDSAVADLDGDGSPEIVLVSSHPGTSLDGYLRAFRTDGSLLWQFPVSRVTSVHSDLSIADVDRDGSPEVIASIGANLYVIDAGGRLKWVRTYLLHNFYQLMDDESTFPVYDLDGDGLPEVIVQMGSRHMVFLRGDNGEEQARWHRQPEPRVHTGWAQQRPRLVDLEGDGAAELVWLENDNGPGGFGNLVALRGPAEAPWRAAPRSYHVHGSQIAVNEDGSVPSAPPAWWTDPATNRYDQPIPRPYAVDPRLQQETRFPYRASGAHHDSPPAEVIIDLPPNNRPPVVTSTPPTAVNRSTVSQVTPFTYQITAVDPDPGDVITYELTLNQCSTPAGTSVDASTGLFQYARAVNDETCTFGVKLTDGHGGVTFHGFSIRFTNQMRTVPNLVGQPERQVLSLLAAVDLNAGTVTRVPDPAPAGQVIAQTPLAGQSVLRATSVDYVVSTGPALEDRDDDGDGTSENEGDCDDTNPAIHPGAVEVPGNGIDENCDGTERNIAELLIEPGAATRAVGEEIAFTATAVYDDGTSGNVTDSALWSSSAPGVASLDAAGRARALSAGSTAVTASFAGVAGHASLDVRSRNAGDQEAPVAAIVSPADGGVITNQAQVMGTASDTNLLRWELAVAPVGQDAFTPIAEGVSSVINGPLGTFDPTLLLNDIYTIRLTAWDTNGNTAGDEVTVQVEGNQKVGHFTLTYEDLTVPVSGIPVQVTRTYDSRDKWPGDFGVGWNLSVRTLRISANRVLGTGWEVLKPGLGFGLVSEGPHFVSVTLPDGKVETFDLEIAPMQSPFVPFTTLQARFVARPGTLGSLTSLDNNNLLVIDPQPGPISLVDDSTLNPYHPDRFRYTATDGTQYILSRTRGLESVRDTNANQVTIGPAGITHSAGPGITFSRDAQGRITAVTDPKGQTQTYAYSPAGDLIAHTDPGGNTTRFFYNRKHGLIRIVDPLGRPVARAEYDEAGRLVALTDAAGSTVTYQHDLASRQELIRDALGRVTLMDYDERGNVLAVTDPLGARTTFTYDGRGNQLSVTDPLGATTSTTYDARDHVLSITDPLGRTTTFTRDSAGRPLTETSPGGHTTRFRYDAQGNLIEITDALGSIATITYDGAGNPVSSVDGTGATTRNAYDAAGRRTQRIDPLGVITSLQYDANGNLLSQREQSGVGWELTYDATNRMVDTVYGGLQRPIEYDAAGRISSMTTSSGLIVSAKVEPVGHLAALEDAGGKPLLRQTHDAGGNLTTATDAMGNVMRFNYDATNRLVTTRTPSGGLEERTYDAAGRVVQVKDALGYLTRYTYDLAGHLITSTDALGGVTSHEYDEDDNLTAVTDPAGRTTRFTYDARRRLVKTELPDGTKESRTYDGAGRLLRLIDRAGNTGTYTYDAGGRLLSVTNPLGQVTRHTYAGGSQRTTTTDANGNTTRFSYDAAQRLTRITYPLGDFESFSCDSAGRLMSQTNGAGETTQYHYDANGRLSGATHPDGSTESYSFTPDHRISTMTDAHGTILVEYDPQTRRLVRVTEPDGSYVRYAYDVLGHRTLVAHGTPLGEQATTYLYDGLGRMTRITDPAGRVTTQEYDAAGNVTAIVRPNGTTSRITYDPLNRVTSITDHGSSNAVLAGEVYTFDALGNRTRVDRADGSSIEYEYDALGRVTGERHLTSGSAVSFESTYVYDPAGNLISSGPPAAPVSYTYNANDQLVAGGGIAYSYDAAGRRVQEMLTSVVPPQIVRYGWDARGMLASFQDSAGATTAYFYDALGDRRAKVGAIGSVSFLVDRDNATELPQIIHQQGPGFNRSFVYGTTLLHTADNGTPSYRLFNQVGSTRSLLGPSGSPTDGFEYEAFGKLLGHAGSSMLPHLFAGEQTDPESGLVYLRARYYDPRTRVFLSRDSWSGAPDDPLSLHRYLYAASNPVNWTDPSGHFAIPEALISAYEKLQVQGQQVLRVHHRLEKTKEVIADTMRGAGGIFAVLTLADIATNPDRGKYWFGGGTVGRYIDLSLTGGAVGNAVELVAAIALAATAYEMIGGKEVKIGIQGIGDFTHTAIGTLPQFAGKNFNLCATEGALANAWRKNKEIPVSARIELCHGFFNLTALPTQETLYGLPSMAGLMVHEFTHIAIGAHDDSYHCSGSYEGRDGKLMNGVLDTAKALVPGASLGNAETYRCWVEDVAVGGGVLSLRRNKLPRLR